MDYGIMETSFWDKAWEEFRQKISPPDTRDFDQAQKWNKRAEGFFKRTSGKHGRKRTEQTFKYLQEFIEFDSGMEVLDIGCGPGTFAIPFAETNMQVTALDPASKMLELLKENLPENKKSRVSTVEGLWELIDIDKYGWRKKFDLVFASMSPGIRDSAALDKMIKCSRKFCFLSSFAGPRRIDLYEKLWPEVLNKEYRNHVSDIIFPFNILYAMGYKPALQFKDTSHTREDTLSDTFEEVKDLMRAEEGELSAQQENRIYDYLAGCAVDGKVPVKVNTTVGMIVWRVDF